MTVVINDVSNAEFIFEVLHVCDTLDEKAQRPLLVGCEHEWLSCACCWHGTARDIGATKNQNTREENSI